jgi:hypothetical protein
MALSVNNSVPSPYNKSGVDTNNMVDKPQSTGKGNIDGKAGGMPDVKAGNGTGATQEADPTEGMTQEEMDAFVDEVATALANWALIETNDPNEAFAVMVQVQAQINKQNRQDMVQAGEAAKNASLEAAGKSKEAGEKLQSGAFKALVISIVVGAVGAVFAGFQIRSLGAAGKSLKEGINATKAGAEVTKKSAAVSKDFADKAKGLTGRDLKNAGRQFSADKASLGAERAGFNAAASGAMAKSQHATTTVGAQTALGNSITGMGSAGANYESTKGQADAKIAEADGQMFQAAAEISRTTQNLRMNTADAAQKMMEAVIEAAKQKLQNKTDRMAANTKV